MHWVINQPSAKDVTELQKTMRSLYGQDLGKFIDRYTKLEMIESARQAEQGLVLGGNGVGQAEGPLLMDANEVKILALIDELRGGPKLEIATKVREGVKEALEALALQLDGTITTGPWSTRMAAQFIREWSEKLPAVAVGQQAAG